MGYFKNRPPFQKRVANSSLLSQSDEILLDDLLFLISCFENNHSEFITKAPSYYIEQYFTLVNEQEFANSYIIRNKVLLTCHLMLHEFQLGIDFADHFLNQKFIVLQNRKSPILVKTSGQKEEWLSANIQLSYFQYLQKLAVNIQVFHACKVQQYPLFQEGQKFIDIQTKLLWLFKISNLVNSGLGQMEILKQALQMVPEDMLLKEIVLVYWSDIIVFYNFLSKEILQLLDYYRHLATHICLQFYELYLQLFQIRNSISDLYKYRKHFDRDNVIKQPKWFDVNKPVHKQIEEFMLKQKLNMGNNTDRATLKPQMSSRGSKSQIALDTRIDLSKLPRQNNTIKTHRAGRQGESEGDDEDFEQLKQILQNQNIQTKLTKKKQQKQQQQQDSQVSFQKQSHEEGTDLPKKD
ncbi:unnamed protein product [Paramecium pentaurelia]|uniref:Uncharacterized protein n=1 Tax=Paramecium pentaurelia TaxID=43138 RepID=A0A8S1UT44_9CILI|nr:unnamed protein product [Paramecium pentaurelia]